MSRYIKSFENDAAIQSAVDNGVLSKPYVAYDESAHTIDWNNKFVDYSAMPLTFKITSDGYIRYYGQYTSSRKTIEYKKNDGEWTSITSSSEGTNIDVVSGDKVCFRGNGVDGQNTNNFKQSTCGFIVYGNIMSLKYSTDFETATTLTKEYEFDYMFNDCTGLTDASNLILPATTLAKTCYRGMFMGCTSLTSIPELPATTLVDYCYSSMFNGCSSLTSAPELPVTTLASSCYSNMFRGCTSLTQAPVLPATTLAQSCYSSMFSGCTNLNYIKCLATDISASNCLFKWVQGVQTTSGTFVKNSSMSSWTTGGDGIPSNWTVIDA